ncbi:Uncharacterized protein conserved in bacteria (DUF2313) [Klebsiella variicola]|uniref:YmfQ family protein n=1 Tax=Klebsiella variicola TaxID=244366 RepID=UPI000E2E0F51|nr:putative phage tail protein [Klebsiella variicola]SXF43156.1 Uncharacterized protein conserved in bacteria (DUF2313) [Klebsiella variicola]
MSLYSVDDYTQALLALMPTGLAWTRDVKSAQRAMLRALGNSFSRSDSDSQALLNGGFPSTALMMLSEWESALGLPDDCVIGEIGSISERQRAVVSKLISTGGLNRNYYINVAAALGYQITINHFRPAMCGMSVCDEPINGEEWPFTWQINVPNSSVRYSYSGTTFCGDALASWGNKQLECSISKIAPSHINIIFAYGLDAELNIPDYRMIFDIAMNRDWPES